MAVDVNLNQNVNVNIPQIANLESVLTEMQSHMKAVSDGFSAVADSMSRGASPKEALASESGRPGGSLKLDSSNLVTKLDELIRVLGNVTKASARATTEEKIAYQRELSTVRDEERSRIREERKTDRLEREEERRSRSMTNWGRALVFGAGAAGVAIGGQYGALSGSQAQSINAGAGNYADFMTQYYNKAADTRQSTISQGAMGAAGLAFAASGFNPVIGAVAFGGAALVNYLSSENTERSKAGTQFGIQRELDAWRMGYAGIGGASTNTGISTGFGNLNLNEAQRLSLSSQFAPYSSTLGNTVFSGKRDVIGGMSSGALNEYNKQLTLSAMMMGTQDVNGLNKNATILSSITGQTPNSVLSELVNINKQYGGDTAANTAKLVQILETTPMGKDQAANLINKYQYNEPFLNNQIAQSTALPSSLFGKWAILKSIGASPEELASGTPSGETMQKIIAGQKTAKSGVYGQNSFLADMWGAAMGRTGENLWARDMAGVLPGAAGGGLPQEPSVMKKAGDMILEQLKNISVDTQTVTATNVYIGGQMGSPVNSGSIRPTSGMPSTGTGADISNGAQKNTNTDSYRRSMQYAREAGIIK